LSPDPSGLAGGLRACLAEKLALPAMV
jgi:hypothetical protein